MRTIKLLAVLGLLAAAPASARADGRRSPSYRAPVARAYVAPAVRPVWVPGYWEHRGPHRFWHQGAWLAPPQPGWSWVAPRWAWDPPRRQREWRAGHWSPPARGYDHPSYR
jgi:hypothetical protein